MTRIRSERHGEGRNPLAGPDTPVEPFTGLSERLRGILRGVGEGVAALFRPPPRYPYSMTLMDGTTIQVRDEEEEQYLMTYRETLAKLGADALLRQIDDEIERVEKMWAAQEREWTNEED